MIQYLIISLQGIGNTVLTIPALKYLYNQGHILDMVISGNAYDTVKALNILRNVFIYDENASFIKNILRLKKKIGGNNYDAVYAMYPNGKRENILSFYLGRKNRCGFKDREGNWRLFKFLIKERIKLSNDTHDILSGLKLVGAPPTYQDYKPSIAIPPRIEKEVKDRYIKEEKRNLVVLHPFSGQEKKRWGINNYRYICQRLIQEKGIKIIVIGSPTERDMIGRFMMDIKGIEKFIHKNILYAAALIKYSTLFLGNDSSLMHIASGLGKPTVAIWGFTDYRRVSPYGDNCLIIRKDLACSPCYTFEHGYNKRCKIDFRCLKGVDKERVYDIISFAIERIRNGENLCNLDFRWVENLKGIKELWSRCKMLVLK